MQNGRQNLVLVVQLLQQTCSKYWNVFSVKPLMDPLPSTAGNNHIIFIISVDYFVYVCSDGIGRSGTFCALMISINRFKAEQMTDIFQTINTIRTQKPRVVANVVSGVNHLSGSSTIANGCSYIQHTLSSIACIPYNAMNMPVATQAVECMRLIKFFSDVKG